MTLVDPFDGTMLDGEDEWLARVTADLLDDDQKLIYADWLAAQPRVVCSERFRR
jgi:uncharacterized protein (TIGR02996 family)